LEKFHGLAFASVEGKSIAPGVSSYNFARIVKKAGLENVRFHDLRPLFTNLMLLKSAKPRVISEALGHTSVAFTLDIYSHIIEEMQSDGMALRDEVSLPTVNARKNNANGRHNVKYK